MSPRVLFLEDEGILAEDIPILLGEKGLEAVGVTSIDKALERFREEDFDAVLLDIMMPPTDDMDEEEVDYGRRTGVQVAQRMREIKPGVPIVVFTVLTDPTIRKELWEVGVARIINKPSELDQIAGVLWQVIRGSSS